MPAYNGTHFDLAARLIREIPDPDQPASPTSNLTIRELMAVKAISMIERNVGRIANFNKYSFLHDCGITEDFRRVRLGDSRYFLDPGTLQWVMMPYHLPALRIPSQLSVDS